MDDSIKRWTVKRKTALRFAAGRAHSRSSFDRLLRKLPGRASVMSVCYEMRPTDYELYRQVRMFGFEWMPFGLLSCCVPAN